MCVSSHISHREERSQQEREEVISPDRLRGVVCSGAGRRTKWCLGLCFNSGIQGVAESAKMTGPESSPENKVQWAPQQTREPKTDLTRALLQEPMGNLGHCRTQGSLPHHTQAPPIPYLDSIGQGEHLNSTCIFHTLSHPSKGKMQSQKFSLHHQAIWHYSSPLRFCIAGV